VMAQVKVAGALEQFKSPRLHMLVPNTQVQVEQQSLWVSIQESVEKDRLAQLGSVSSFDRTMKMDTEVIETSIQHFKIFEVLYFIILKMALLSLSIKQSNKIKLNQSFIYAIMAVYLFDFPLH